MESLVKYVILPVRQVALVATVGLSNFTRESRCLAAEPKHFPLAIAFVLIIKITLSLTCTRGCP